MTTSFFRRKPRSAVPNPEPAVAEATPAAPRDTDADWQIIGARDPFYGVLTDPRFHRDAITDEARADFFASGEIEVGRLLAYMRSLYPGFTPKSALDFGCGVGRLTQPLARLCNDVVGVDVSPGMLVEARRHNRTRAIFLDQIPARTFDWVVSFIVLQHVTPELGYPLIAKLLKAVGPEGAISLQIVFARTASQATDAGVRIVIGDDDVWPAGQTVDITLVPPGIMIMHDYDLGRIISLFYVHGFREIHLDHTDHDGAIGAVIHARRRG
jgi:SAM-dependent methyltransferase